MKRLITPETLNATRLDLALASLLEVSRTRAKKLIEQDTVLVNDGPVSAHLLVHTGDTITLTNESLLEKPKKSTVPPPPLDILFENDDVLVVNKPAGLLVHDTGTSVEPTLVDALLAYIPQIAGIGDSKVRPGIVHRLDKDASGCLVIAKNQAAFAYLKAQFGARNVKKHYTVLVEGSLSRDAETLTFPIARSKSLGRMAARPTSQEGREAITHYTVLQRFPHHTLVDVIIETGRTHQIRVHMLAMSHPVVGDNLYTIRGLKVRNIGRLFLHASSLSLTLPNGEELNIEAPLPKELNDVLASIPTV